MKNNTLLALLCLLGVCLWAGSPVWGEGSPDFRQKLDEFIAIALEQNPGLHEAQNRINVFKEITPQAGSLDDPMLQFGLMNLPVDTLAFDQADMTQKQITLSQKLPFPGKLGLREGIAAKSTAVSEQSYEGLKLELIRQVKHSFYELCFILSALDITRENKTLLEQFISITESKYSVGKGLQQDVLKAQVELSKIMDELIQLNRKKATEQARLNNLMNKLPQEPLSIPHGLQRTAFVRSIEDLQALAEKNSPFLKELKIHEERFQLAGELAEKEFYPDFNVGVRYGAREDGPRFDRPDFVSVFVGVNIPLWYKTKQSRKVAEERFRVSQVQDAYQDRRNRIFLRIKELMDEQKRATQTLELIDHGILPQARQSLEAALAGYSVDKVDFLTLLDNQVTLFRWQLKYHEELVRHEKVLAEMEQVVGTGLNP